MDRPELWGLIDSVSRRFPPGGHHRMTKAELLEWLAFTAECERASRDTRKDAKKALKWVPKLIGSHYEVECTARPPEPAPPTPVPEPKKQSVQLTLF